MMMMARGLMRKYFYFLFPNFVGFTPSVLLLDFQVKSTPKFAEIKLKATPKINQIEFGNSLMHGTTDALKSSRHFKLYH